MQTDLVNFQQLFTEFCGTFAQNFRIFHWSGTEITIISEKSAPKLQNVYTDVLRNRLQKLVYLSPIDGPMTINWTQLVKKEMKKLPTARGCSGARSTRRRARELPSPQMKAEMSCDARPHLRGHTLRTQMKNNES